MIKGAEHRAKLRCFALSQTLIQTSYSHQYHTMPVRAQSEIIELHDRPYDCQICMQSTNAVTPLTLKLLIRKHKPYLQQHNKKSEKKTYPYRAAEPPLHLQQCSCALCYLIPLYKASRSPSRMNTQNDPPQEVTQCV